MVDSRKCFKETRAPTVRCGAKWRRRQRQQHVLTTADHRQKRIDCHRDRSAPPQLPLLPIRYVNLPQSQLHASDATAPFTRPTTAWARPYALAHSESCYASLLQAQGQASAYSRCALLLLRRCAMQAGSTVTTKVTNHWNRGKCEGGRRRDHVTPRHMT